MANNANYTWAPAQPRILEQVDEVIEFNEFGIARASQSFEANYDTAEAEVSKRLTHPKFSWLKRKTGSIRRIVANSAIVTINFEGVPPDTDEKYYTLKASLSAAPIGTHPKFHEFAVPENGAIFDGDGNFVGWDIEIEGSKNVFYGVESWLVPGYIYEEVWIRGTSSSEANEFEKSGKIDTPPASSVRIKISGRNWLHFGGEVKPIGDGSKMTRRWRLSGPDGWIDDIYGEDAF